MSDYIGNLIQREIGTGAKSLRPMTPPAYLHIPQEKMTASAQERFEVFDEHGSAATTLSSKRLGTRPDIETPSRARVKTKPQTVPEAEDELPARVAPRLSPSEIEQETPQIEMAELISSRDAGVEQMESLPSPILPEIGKPKTAEKGAIKPRPEPLSLRFGRVQNMPPVERTNTSKSETTIRVAIGRIEVRAIMPQQTLHKAPAPAQPKMSLEDYLRQRSGEKKP